MKPRHQGRVDKDPDNDNEDSSSEDVPDDIVVEETS